MPKNKNLEKFLSWVQEGNLSEVSKDLYGDFVRNYIKKYMVPCENILAVNHLRKRIGAAYIELSPIEGVDPVDTGAGILKSYEPKYKVPVCYGWIELEPDKKSYFMCPEIYKSWFHHNVLHFDAQKKVMKDEKS